ncbi:hypothetical protein RyT2_11790 [Pseudolactococcus yaeyamensis]
MKQPKIKIDKIEIKIYVNQKEKPSKEGTLKIAIAVIGAIALIISALIG